MTARPWMPFYFSDYLADTGHLSTTEHGAYLLLIAHYWSHGSLPSDEAVIARITRMTARQWAQSRDVLRSLFGDNWCHKRIDKELAQAIEKSKVNSANAKRRHSDGIAKAVRSDTQLQPQPELQREDKKEVALCAPVGVARETNPAGWPIDAFDQFYRKFPHKVGKQAALKAFAKAKRSAKAPPFSKIITALDQYIASKPPDRSWCNPATWLNEGRWDDEPAANGGVSGYRGPRALQDDSKSISAAAGRLAEAAQRGEFTFGPRPSLLPDPDTPPVFLISKG